MLYYLAIFHLLFSFVPQIIGNISFILFRTPFSKSFIEIHYRRHLNAKVPLKLEDHCIVYGEQNISWQYDMYNGGHMFATSNISHNSLIIWTKYWHEIAPDMMNSRNAHYIQIMLILSLHLHEAEILTES